MVRVWYMVWLTQPFMFSYHHIIRWMVAKSCTTNRMVETQTKQWDVYHLSTGAGIRNHPQYNWSPRNGWHILLVGRLNPIPVRRCETWNQSCGEPRVGFGVAKSPSPHRHPWLEWCQGVPPWLWKPPFIHRCSFPNTWLMKSEDFPHSTPIRQPLLVEDNK
jgi:hypothetical protein